MSYAEHRSPILPVMVMLLAFAALATCGGDDSTIETEPTIASAPAPSDRGDASTAGAVADGFTFADDDLCEWITADEVAGFFNSVYATDVEAEPVPDTNDTMGPDECHWRLTSVTGEGYYEVSAGNAEALPMVPVDEIVEYGGGMVGGTVSGHPALGEGVVVQSEGWGIYSFWVPPRDDYLTLFVTHTEDGVSTGVDSASDAQDRVDAQAQFFAFADRFIRELGWTP